MTYQSGQSGNPNGNGGWSTRRKETREALDAIKSAGYVDPLVALAKIAHESSNEGIKCSAQATLAKYFHNPLQSIPSPRFIETPIEVPDFTCLEDAEKFLARIPTLLARGELDLDFAESLTKSTVGYIQSQYAKQGIDLKAQAQGATNGEQVIHVTGGLPELPGTQISMPVLNGHGFQMLAHNGQTQNPSSIDGVHTDTTTIESSPAGAPFGAPASTTNDASPAEESS